MCSYKWHNAPWENQYIISMKISNGNIKLHLFISFHVHINTLICQNSLVSIDDSLMLVYIRFVSDPGKFFMTKRQKETVPSLRVFFFCWGLQRLSFCFHHLSVSSEIPPPIAATSMARSEYASPAVCTVSLYLSYLLGIASSFHLYLLWVIGGLRIYSEGYLL